MIRTRIERSDAQVVCTGQRTWLRASPSAADDPAVAGGVLRIETAARADGRWRRVDDDPLALTRATTRLLTSDPGAARVFTRHAAELAGVVPHDPSPVTGLVRAAYPLLAGEDRGRMAGIPDTIPGELQGIFRQRTLRAAAGLLFADRATRPVVRMLGIALTGRGPVDLFAVTVAMAAAPLLEPDRLVRVVDAPGGRGWDLAPLGPDERERLRRLVAELSEAHRERLLRDGLASREQRDRLRFVVSGLGTVPPAERRAGWEDLALAAAVGTVVAS